MRIRVYSSFRYTLYLSKKEEKILRENLGFLAYIYSTLEITA